MYFLEGALLINGIIFKILVLFTSELDINLIYPILKHRSTLIDFFNLASVLKPFVQLIHYEVAAFHYSC